METTSVIHKLFDGVVPERASAIESITEQYGPQFRLIGDREGFNLDAGGSPRSSTPADQHAKCGSLAMQE